MKEGARGTLAQQGWQSSWLAYQSQETGVCPAAAPTFKAAGHFCQRAQRQRPMAACARHTLGRDGRHWLVVWRRRAGLEQRSVVEEHIMRLVVRVLHSAARRGGSRGEGPNGSGTRRRSPCQGSMLFSPTSCSPNCSVAAEKTGRAAGTCRARPPPTHHPTHHRQAVGRERLVRVQPHALAHHQLVRRRHACERHQRLLHGLHPVGRWKGQRVHLGHSLPGISGLSVQQSWARQARQMRARQPPPLSAPTWWPARRRAAASCHCATRTPGVRPAWARWAEAPPKCSAAQVCPLITRSGRKVQPRPTGPNLEVSWRAP